MSKEIMQFDDAMFESKLDAMIKTKVEDIVNAMPDASGRRDHERRQIRAQDRSEGVPGRSLRARTDGQGRQARAEGAQTQGRPVRVGGGRTLPAARVQCRGGADGNVSGGYVHPAGRRHRPAVVGRPHALADAFRQAQACVCRDRWVEETPAGGRMAVRVRGRRVAQAFLGRARGERPRARRHRNQRGRPPGGHRGRRGHGGGLGQLGAVLSWHDRTRPQGRAARGGRPVRGTRPRRQLHASKSEIPAVHGAFRAQRALQDASDPQGGRPRS